jgi:Copper transport outer membrane protein, MctB
VINFRYHLVSLVAVFLALAIGLFIGATELRPKVTASLNHISKVERDEIDSLEAGTRQLQQQISNDQAFAQAAVPRLLPGLLDGQRVALVIAPGADGATISGVTTALQQAGAKVTGQVVLQQAFFDTGASTESRLEALARQLDPPGLDLDGQVVQQIGDDQISGQEEAATVLAAAIVTKDVAGLTSAQGTAILRGFANQGYLQVNPANGGTALPSASLAVVIIPATPPADGDSDPANIALVAVTQQLQDGSHGAVLAGSYPGSGPGSAIDELTSGNTGAQLSSVDCANTEVGQIMVAQALNQLLNGHKPAAYGFAAGAVPSPAPTPPATQSSSSTGTLRGREERQ